jgi:hypothetical protein
VQFSNFVRLCFYSTFVLLFSDEAFLFYKHLYTCIHLHTCIFFFTTCNGKNQTVFAQCIEYLACPFISNYIIWAGTVARIFNFWEAEVRESQVWRLPVLYGEILFQKYQKTKHPTKLYKLKFLGPVYKLFLYLVLLSSIQLCKHNAS